ncbi:hypothetical protein SCOCK_30044 [Actinacidiphila cocklensis]|uniref:Uncharacterized protein n=1 Tax=Actinacidiphila cocklensis TaxID=887465 RepID=A0A9W4E7G8_9ACTN|nr:hypothetical protein SCOCK_30044 [Actinacidiphila cocklensis]
MLPVSHPLRGSRDRRRIPVSGALGRSGTVSARPADVAQLVEHHLAKVRVASSNLVVRSAKRRPRSM